MASSPVSSHTLNVSIRKNDVNLHMQSGTAGSHSPFGPHDVILYGSESGNILSAAQDTLTTVPATRCLALSTTTPSHVAHAVHVTTASRRRLTGKKGKFIYSAVSSPLDRSKRFTLYFPDRPVHSGTILASLGSIQPYATINARRLLVHISTTVYSQVLIYSGE